MTNVLIIGATGSIGQAVRKKLINETNDELTLFARSAGKIFPIQTRERVIAGDVFNEKDLAGAIKGQDVVFVALSGPLAKLAQAIITAMNRQQVSRLLFISSMGIYNEIPASIGSRGNLEFNPVLQPYRDAADLIEQSNLDYTIIRPGWFDNGAENYTVTVKGEPFGGHDVARASIADLVLRLINDPTLYVRNSIGIHRP